MRLKPTYPKHILKLPYFKGLRTGLMMGVGTAWIVLSDTIIDVTVAMLIFLIGSYLYWDEVKDDYNFDK